MKTLSMFTAALLAASAAVAQIPSEYAVAPWHGFSESAVTYSLDDLTPNQLPIAIPIFDRYGAKVSLNVVTSWVKPEDKEKLKLVAQNGHEIASHTCTHPNLAQLSAQEFEKEISESKRILQEYSGSECITLVYPYCVAAHKEIIPKYYISARCCSRHIEPHTPADMLDISSVGVGTESDVNTAEEFNKWVDDGVAQKGWCTFLIHAIDGDGGYSPIKSTELEKHLAYVAKNPSKFWVATFAQVSKYILERDALTIKEVKKGNKITVTVGCKATSNITALNEPITISRVLPQGCTTAKTKAPNATVSNGKIIFDVVPGKTYKISCK
ncbi:MAG: polysaccharide deacetylase family protein [Bacteroidales bacterium]|nr:polysaccharide deacetylase family protein [Bacteroidales bacterium]